MRFLIPIKIYRALSSRGEVISTTTSRAMLATARLSSSDFSRDVAVQPILWQNCGKITYPTALIALSFLNGIGYRYLNVRINSVDDASISCENFVKFGPVPSELTELICERQVTHGQKTGTFSRISPDLSLIHI